MSCIDQLSDAELDEMSDSELDEFLAECAAALDSGEDTYREPGTTWDEPEED